MKKSILVTGCSSGIGKCIAHGLAARGFRVFATARAPDDIAEIERQGLESLALDLNDPASIDYAVGNVLEKTGGTLYGLFNNAAYGQPGAVEDLSRSALRAQFETNLFGTIQLTNRVIPAMRAQGYGRIIQNSSILGLIALPYRGAYTATKFALEALSDTLRLELQGTGIYVSLIEPGPILSRFRQNSYAAYKKYIDPEHSPHRERYQAMERRLTTQGAVVPFTLPPEAVLKRVIHALESRRPRTRYYVTFPTYLLAVLRRILPSRALDRVLRKI